MSTIETLQSKFLADVTRDEAGIERAFPGEHFIHYWVGVLSSTEVDAHQEQMSPDAVKDSWSWCVRDIRWVGAHHDPKNHKIGRVIASKEVSVGDHLYVMAVTGVYDQAQYPTFSSLGLSDEAAEASIGSASEILEINFTYNPRDIDSEEFETVARPQGLCVSHTEKIEKATVATVALFVVSAFAAGALAKLGADTCEYLKHVAQKILANKKKRQFLIETICGTSDVNCVLMTSDPAEIDRAILTTNAAFGKADSIIQNALTKEGIEITEITLEFNPIIDKWFPSHATTKNHGIISDQLRLVSLQGLGGMSLTASLPSTRKELGRGSD
jgi:hypothetical protein